jgi:hypothetical protein
MSIKMECKIYPAWLNASRRDKMLVETIAMMRSSPVRDEM